jgi:hypothetical protein
MKIELTIKTDYLGAWRAYEGLREFLSNAQDATKEFGATLDVRYRKDTGVLVIENDGCVLPHEALLLGHTTKNGRGDMIGRFGEGIKGATLALVRAGHAVKIRSGDEVWVPKIERSEKFDAKVLVFYVNKGREFKNRVQVEVGGIAQETYDNLGDHFLFLGKVKDKEHVETLAGTLLLGDRFAGKLFVRGVFVQRDETFRHGYDFREVEIDRDRKMLARYDVNHHVQQIWRTALATRPDLLKPFVGMLETQAADVAGINQFNATYLSDAAKAAVAESFVKRHGDKALPVSGLAESAEVEHLGRKGVICPEPLRLVLEQTLGTVAENKAKLANEVVKKYSWHELSTAEKAHLARAIDLVNRVEPITLLDVDVADFRDAKLRGLFDGGRVLLAKHILADRSMSLRVLVHEVAHKAGGGDGEKDHVSNIERIWSGIVDVSLPARTQEGS